MTTTQTSDLLHGEPIDLLVEVLRHLKLTPRPDGMMGVDAELPDRLGLPFTRAIMRIESRMILDDVDALRDGPDELRTPEQRSADAFVELVAELGTVLDERNDHRGEARCQAPR